MISASRDKALIYRLAALVRAQAQEGPILLMSEGLSAYDNAWKRAFCNVLREGKQGRPRLQQWAELVIGQVVKRYEKNRVAGVEHRLVQGTQEQFEALAVAEQKMHTSYIERRTQGVPGHLPAASVRSGA